MSADEAAQMREWSEIAEDWVSGDVIEVRFRTDGEHVWVWSPAGDGLDLDPEHSWARVAPPRADNHPGLTTSE